MSGRAGTAPTLASLYAIMVGSDHVGSSGGTIGGGEVIGASDFPDVMYEHGVRNIIEVGQKGEDNVHADDWLNDGDFIVRRHEQARSCLFTPVRVPGAPSTTTISPVRISVGKFCSNGSSFKVVDS